MLVLPYNLIGDGTPEAVAFCEAFVIHIPEFLIMGIQQSEQRSALRLPGCVFVRIYAKNDVPEIEVG